MKTFVALLRGINVGKAKRVPMAELRALLGGLGYTGVATLLNSGNAVFRAESGAPSRHAARIAEAITTQMGVDVPVIVKPVRELAAIVEENPLVDGAPDPSRVLVVFTQDAASLRVLEPIAAQVEAPERFVIGRRAAYSHCPAGILASRSGAALLAKVGRSVTTRNWATVLKLRALASDHGG